jgi:hypothetical protein
MVDRERFRVLDSMVAVVRALQAASGRAGCGQGYFIRLLDLMPQKGMEDEAAQKVVDNLCKAVFVLRTAEIIDTVPQEYWSDYTDCDGKPAVMPGYKWHRKPGYLMRWEELFNTICKEAANQKGGLLRPDCDAVSTELKLLYNMVGTLIETAHTGKPRTTLIEISKCQKVLREVRDMIRGNYRP